eukprot:jgi/Hompol1/2723/HPOL_006148-RA
MPSTSENPNVIEVKASDAPIDAVTVYTDRAEVARNIKAELTEGFNELRLVGPGPLEQDSI